MAIMPFARPKPTRCTRGVSADFNVFVRPVVTVLVPITEVVHMDALVSIQALPGAHMALGPLCNKLKLRL